MWTHPLSEEGDEWIAASDGPEGVAATLNLAMEEAVAMHHVWLAHVAGRPLARNTGELEAEASQPLGAGGGGAGGAGGPSRGGGGGGGSGGDGGLGGGSASTRFMLRRSYGGAVENLLALSGARPAAALPTAGP